MTVFPPTKATGFHFYKYKSAEQIDRLKSIVLDHELYLPSPAQLNDPADCRPKLAPMTEDEMVTFLRNDYIRRNPVIALDLLEKQETTIRERIQTPGLDWFLREATKILNAQMNGFRVYSLSKRFNNLSLWANYAANHAGYCLEFANEGPLFGEHTFEVIYAESAPPFSLVDGGKRDARFLVYKKPEWSNEEDVRLIRARGSGPKVGIDPRWLTRVILGKDMSPSHQQQIREWIKKRQPELTVVQAYFDELHVELRIKD